MTKEIQLGSPPDQSPSRYASKSPKPMASTSDDTDPTLYLPLTKPPKSILPTPIAVSHTGTNKLTLVPLIFLIFFEVAGGPYGAEPAVSSAGPLYALIGFLVFPFIWSIPESLVTAELSSALPGNGGFVVWADRAFGPFFGWLMGTWKYLSGVINCAAFPALFADYLSRVYSPVGSGSGYYITVTVMNIVLSILNFTGLSIVGWFAVVLGVLSLSPFVLMTGIAIPKIKPSRWLTKAENKDWRLFFNTLFWNLNFWDSASTMAGEVDKPGKTFPRALVVAVIMTSLGYILPLMAGTGATNASPDAWGNGFFADAAGMIAGKWLKYWIEVGAVLSSVGLYEAQLSSGAFQLVGMADLGLLPKFFAHRAPFFETPWVGILLSTLITMGLSFLSFETIVASANFLYSLGMILEFGSFIWLRVKHPDLFRPYRVPLRLPGLVIMCLVPSAFLILVMAIATWKVFVISVGFTAAGIAVYFIMRLCKAKGCLKFSTGDSS
ncbi:Amino acid permease family protein [Rhynchospora pubera]|uniref:Polyamine transporter PUT1 n=1 Tax=Rhynchospora pubera TaxID=906938 RepID=A0AAV8CC99_9POAL|nr:Amino acid permease family protein [Rhynchospora pubera]